MGKGRVHRCALLAATLLSGGDALLLPLRAQTVSPAPVPGGSMELKVRRLPDSVELVIEGVGAAPQLQQTTRGATWQGLLITPVPKGLRRGPQRLSLPELGLQTISLQGAGTTYRLEVVPMPGYPVGRPVVSADGRNLILSFSAPAQTSLQTLTPDIRTPGRVPQSGFVPPLQPRAVAPPVGDMAVGTMMLSNPSYLNVSGPPVTMTLRNAPARDVLMALSRLGGYGFVYVDDHSAGSGSKPAESGGNRPISISFRSESYGRAVNSALLAAGLQGKQEGNMILAGPNVLGKSFGAQMSKVYRLNQASANSAADYLANLGATINKTYTTTAVTSDIQSAGTAQVGTATQTSQTATTTQIDSYGASQGPLRGLIGTTDSRLGTITLVGDPRVVAIAENYLKQLDLRQRQVALAVQVLDVSLNNAQEIANSFAMRWGNNFIVNDNGQLLGAFGKNLPATENDFTGLASSEIVNENSSSFRSDSATFTINDSRSLTDSDVTKITRLITSSYQGSNVSQVPGRANTTIALTGSLTASRVRDIASLIQRATGFDVNASAGSDSSTSSQFTGFRRRNPGLLYPKDNFFDFVRAQIVSRTSKLLASPTLILQENPALLREGAGDAGGGSSSGSSGEGTANQGLDAYTIDSPVGRRRANEAAVRVGTNVVTNVTVTTQAQGGQTQCELELSTAGLTLGARIEKIDDNGFVTFALSPSVSAVTDTIPGPPACTSEISILSVRRLDTGAVRVRDGQTLVLTGVISDFDVAEVSKWPILGDLPLIGQFFRASGSNREKRELVILVTPRIVNDNEGGIYGYGYQPSTTQSRDFLRTNQLQ